MKAPFLVNYTEGETLKIQCVSEDPPVCRSGRGVLYILQSFMIYDYVEFPSKQIRGPAHDAVVHAHRLRFSNSVSTLALSKETTVI